MKKYGVVIRYDGNNGEILSVDGVKYVILSQNLLSKDIKVGDKVSCKEEVFETVEIKEFVATFMKKINESKWFIFLLTSFCVLCIIVLDE